MRAVAAVALVFLLTLVPPQATAPPAPRTSHLTVISGTLTPGVNQSWALDFEGEPLSEGWVFLLEARVQGGNVTAVLSIDGTTAHTWIIPPAVAWYDTFVLPETGVYHLTLSNSGATDATFSLYFDQSCNCSVKWFPKKIYDGLLVFDIDVPRPSTVFAQFTKPAAMSLRVTAAFLAGSGGRWPGDFTKLAEVDRPVQRQADPSIPPVWLYELSVPAPAGARVYYFVEGVSYVAANDTGMDDGPRLVGLYAEFGAPPSSLLPIFLGALASSLAVAGLIVWKWPAISERLGSRSRRQRESTKGKGAKNKGLSGKNRKGNRATPARRGGDRDARDKRTSRGRSRRS